MHDQKMTMLDDLVVKIISYLPLKFVIQCKVLNKDFYARISGPKFLQTLSQRQKISTLISSLNRSVSETIHKISLNSVPASHYFETTTLPVRINILAISKGLVLIDFNESKNFCILNPITGAHHLIRYPDRASYCRLSVPGFIVDYPTSDHYMLVIASGICEPFERDGYNFSVLSSELSGVWREIPLRMNIHEPFHLHVTKPVYVNDSFHWLRWKGGVLAFHTKKEKAIIIDLPELTIMDYDNPFSREWLGVTHGLLTLVCTYEKFLVIATYDYGSNEWSVSHSITIDFIMGLDYYNYCFPVWIDDSERVFFLVEYPWAHDHDSKINNYKITADLKNCLGIFKYDFYAFAPTLASVHTRLSHVVHRKHLSSITATLDELKRFIRES
ncbi:hypothetical protein FXO38_13345 [Capsicum annuum]|uniref:F-box associated domain-containing protein n=2 Tax=Capsicum annuum TaxID=4072 RepID=A0A2G3A0T8_CAPAN|nr:hypothetical protein FXO38_13345 [Capsicum annuum]PHT87811.1 hypothetical protein T459_09917 [Capsicum annuum]